MDKEQIKAIIDDLSEYDESQEDTIRAWLKDGYSKRMRWVAVNIYLGYAICLVPGILSAIAFFRTDDLGYKILYAAICLFCSQWTGFISVFGWVMMQRPRIHREIKRLELRIAELTEIVQGK